MASAVHGVEAEQVELSAAVEEEVDEVDGDNDDQSLGLLDSGGSKFDACWWASTVLNLK